MVIRFVVDGGSNETFVSNARKIGVTLIQQKESGMSPGRRQAFKEASMNANSKVIIWTEPEKISMIEDCVPYAALPILEGDCDIVVPKRSEESFKTYPTHQAESERKANMIWNGIMRSRNFLKPEDEDIDLWFGPKFFKNDPRILKLFTDRYSLADSPNELFKKSNPDDWANAVMFPIVAALKEGLIVKSVTVPYVHPPEQTQIEKDSYAFKEKRQQQRRGIIVEMVEFVKYLEGNSKSLIRKLE